MVKDAGDEDDARSGRRAGSEGIQCLRCGRLVPVIEFARCAGGAPLRATHHIFTAAGVSLQARRAPAVL